MTMQPAPMMLRDILIYIDREHNQLKFKQLAAKYEICPEHARLLYLITGRRYEAARYWLKHSPNDINLFNRVGYSIDVLEKFKVIKDKSNE